MSDGETVSDRLQSTTDATENGEGSLVATLEPQRNQQTLHAHAAIVRLTSNLTISPASPL